LNHFNHVAYVSIFTRSLALLTFLFLTSPSIAQLDSIVAGDSTSPGIYFSGPIHSNMNGQKIYVGYDNDYDLSFSFSWWDGTTGSNEVYSVGGPLSMEPAEYAEVMDSTDVINAETLWPGSSNFGFFELAGYTQDYMDPPSPLGAWNGVLEGYLGFLVDLQNGQDTCYGWVRLADAAKVIRDFACTCPIGFNQPPVFVKADPQQTLEPAVSIYPNPDSNELNLTFKNWKKENLELRILDLNGKTLRAWKISTGANTTSEFDVSTFSAGIYMLEIKGKGVQMIKKLVIE
ncbi:MAG: T9SS type A sorting domain-containing protein, partial [Bacteroidota bacterium]